MKTWKKGAVIGGTWGFLSYWYYFLAAWGELHDLFPGFYKLLALPAYLVYKLGLLHLSIEGRGIIIILIGTMMGGVIGYLYGRRKEK